MGKNEKKGSRHFADKLKALLKKDRVRGSKPADEQGTIVILGTEPEETAENGLEKKEHYRFEADKKYFTICVYALGTIAIAAFIIYIIMNLSSIAGVLHGFIQVISTFIAAFFIAFILNPFVKWVDRNIFLKVFKMQSVKGRTALSILVTYVVILWLLILGISYVIPQITSSISDLIRRQDKIFEDAIKVIEQIELRFQLDLSFIRETLDSRWDKLVEYAKQLVDMQFVSKIANIGLSIIQTAVNVLLSIAISIYMLYDKQKLSKMIMKVIYAVIPVKNASSITGTLKECGTIFSSFVVGKAIDSLIIGIICFAAMSIAGLPFAMLVSVIVGITNMIPYFGPFIGAIPGIVLFLCIHPVDAVIFTIMILAIQQFDGWILGPYILGESTGLGPLWVIFSITVGGAYAGVAGMFLGVPVLAVVSYLLNRIIDEKLKKKKVTVK